MAQLHTYRTGIVFTLSDSADAVQYDVDLTIRFTVTPGAEATREEPGYGPSVEIRDAYVLSGIGTIKRSEENAPDWLWPFLERDEDLAAELLAHAQQQDEYARDQADDARREELMMEER
jgi:hypothetical protein